MTERVNGSPKQGAWFERDVSWLKVTLAAAADYGINGNVEHSIEVLETRGTVLAFNEGASSTELSVLLGHAGGAFEELDGSSPVLAELAAGADIVSVEVGSGFLIK